MQPEKPAQGPPPVQPGATAPVADASTLMYPTTPDQPQASEATPPSAPTTFADRAAAFPQPEPAATGSGAKATVPAKKPNPNTTQNTLQLSEVRDNMAIMRDGSFRAVVACKSINFDLMSSREREGVEYSYQNFLNSLYFPVQVFIRSQRVDIGPYIDRLVGMRRNQDNMLLGVLMDDYINFIDILSQEANIMDKSFFIVIPFFPAGDITDIKGQAKGFFGKLFAKQSNEPIKIDEAAYTKAKDEIKNRVDSVMSGLFQIGVKSVQLNTKELGELYYNIYNPDTAVREPLGDFENVTSTYVMKGQGDVNQSNLGGTA